MARVCVGCGLTTDSAGNLIVAGSGVVGDNSAFPVTTDCGATAGTHIYCDSATGELFGEPEKFFSMRRVGKNLIPNNPQIDPGTLPGATSDSTPFNVGTPMVVAFTNPSPCRPMNMLIEAGVSHMLFQHGGTGEDGTGDYHIEAGTTMTITGSVAVPAQGMGHQIWQHKDQSFTTTTDYGAIFDSMGARSYANPIVIPAGGSVSLSVQGFITIFSEQGGCFVQNFTIDLVYTAWND